MLLNLALGTLLISGTVLIHTFGLVLLSQWMSRIIHRLRLHRHDLGKMIAMISVVLGLFALHTVEIWAWAATYVVVGAIGGLESALYFSTVTFSTLGANDVAPVHAWQLFASLEGINGFLLIGWSTAYLVAASTRHGPFRIGEHF